MKTKDIVLTLLIIGALFSTIKSFAVEGECGITEPGMSVGPVCFDIPLGPRFTVRK